MSTEKSKNLVCIQMAVVAITFLVLYYPFIQTMVADWDKNGNYSHGYLIPFIAGYMIYSIRNDLKAMDDTPSSWGLVVIILALCQLIVAKIGAEYFLQRTSMIVVLFGISLFFFGKNKTAKVSIPLIYLMFMVPIPAIIWNRVAFPMQLFASGITEQVISMIGIPIFREGNVLYLPETTIEVVDACSGLRSLVSMFALSGAFAFFLDLSRMKKAAIFLSAAPIAILINIIRLVSTAVMAKWMGEKAAQGFLHDISGFFVFVIGLLMLLGFKILLSRKGSRLQTQT
jgi:exosortase